MKIEALIKTALFSDSIDLKNVTEIKKLTPKMTNFAYGNFVAPKSEIKSVSLNVFEITVTNDKKNPRTEMYTTFFFTSSGRLNII